MGPWVSVDTALSGAHRHLGVFLPRRAPGAAWQLRTDAGHFCCCCWCGWWPRRPLGTLAGCCGSFPPRRLAAAGAALTPATDPSRFSGLSRVSRLCGAVGGWRVHGLGAHFVNPLALKGPFCVSRPCAFPIRLARILGGPFLASSTPLVSAKPSESNRNSFITIHFPPPPPLDWKSVVGVFPPCCSPGLARPLPLRL